MSQAVEEASDIVQNSNQLVERLGAVSQVLDTFNKWKDQVVPGSELENTMKELRRCCNDTSKESALLIGEIKTLTMTAMDKYHYSMVTIYGWCGTVSQLLKIYLKLLNQHDEQNTALGQDILDKVLSGGIEKMNEAQIVLRNCSENFNQAAGKFIALKAMLLHQCEEQHNLSTLEMITTGGNICLTAVTALTFPLVSLILFKSLVEGSSKRAEMESLQKKSTYFLAKVENANIDIDFVKKKLAGEVRIIEDLKSHTYVTTVIMPHQCNTACSKIVIAAIKELIDQCNAYRKRYNKENSDPQVNNLRLRDIVFVLLYIIFFICNFCLDFYLFFLALFLMILFLRIVKI